MGGFFGRMGKSRSRRERRELDEKKRAADVQARLLEAKGGPVPSLIQHGLGTLAGGGGRLSINPRGSSDADIYAPARDMFRLGPKLIQAALTGFDATIEKWPDWYGDWLRARGVTQADIGQAAERLAYAVREFTTNPKVVKTPAQAMEATGFFKCRPEAQAAIFMRLGEVTVASYFVSIRDVTPPDGTPPNQASLDELVVQARAFAEEYRHAREAGSL